MLVVDGHTLRPVDLLDLVHQVQLHLAGAEDPEHLVRVDRALDQLLADPHVIAVRHEQPRAHRHLVGDLLGTIVGNDDDLADLLGLLELDPPLHLADGRHALGNPGLEEFLDPGQAVGDVLARHTTGVEGPHRQLGTRLTDRCIIDLTDKI